MVLQANEVRSIALWYVPLTSFGGWDHCLDLLAPVRGDIGAI